MQFSVLLNIQYLNVSMLLQIDSKKMWYVMIQNALLNGNKKKIPGHGFVLSTVTHYHWHVLSQGLVWLSLLIESCTHSNTSL